MVDGILEHAGDRAVVFGGDEEDALGGGDLGLQPGDGGGGVAIVILVVERQIADLEMLEGEIGMRQLGETLGQFTVKRIFAQTADNDADLISSHPYSPSCTIALCGK